MGLFKFAMLPLLPKKIEDPLERLANSELARATKPIDIIVAHVIQSFASEFDQWTIRGEFDINAKYSPYDDSYRFSSLEHFSKGRFDYKFSSKDSAERDYSKRRSYRLETFSYIKDDRIFNLEKDLGMKILSAYYSLCDSIQKTKAAAEKAKQEMEENEALWNIAENMLGMKRDKTGALIAVSEPKAEAKPRRPKVVEPFPKKRKRTKMSKCGAQLLWID